MAAKEDDLCDVCWGIQLLFTGVTVWVWDGRRWGQSAQKFCPACRPDARQLEVPLAWGR